MTEQEGSKLEAFLDFKSHTLTLRYTMDVVKNCIASALVMAAGWFVLSKNPSPTPIISIGVAIACFGLGLLLLNIIQLMFVGMKEWSTYKAPIAVVGATVVFVILLYLGMTVCNIRISSLPI